jgi:hypothetical protein
MKTEQEAWIEVATESNIAVDAYLREVWPDLPEHYGMPVDGVRKVISRLEAIKEAAEKWRNTAFDQAGSDADCAANNELCQAVDDYFAVDENK